eukprot:4852998-Alexandrium_andersonii.AAC.1
MAPRARRPVAPGNNSDDEGDTLEDYLEAVRAQEAREASRSPRGAGSSQGPLTAQRPRSLQRGRTLIGE